MDSQRREDSFAPPTGRRVRKQSNVEDLALVCEIAEKEFKHEILHDENETSSNGNYYYFILHLLANTEVANLANGCHLEISKMWRWVLKIWQIS